MSKPKNHVPGLVESVMGYALENSLDITHFSPWHWRITDGGFVTVDFWTTGRYFIVFTDYEHMAGGGDERTGEKGQLPVVPRSKLSPFLDGIFFAGDAK